MKRNNSMKNKQINTVFSVILLFFFIFHLLENQQAFLGELHTNEILNYSG